MVSRMLGMGRTYVLCSIGPGAAEPSECVDDLWQAVSCARRRMAEGHKCIILYEPA